MSKRNYNIQMNFNCGQLAEAKIPEGMRQRVSLKLTQIERPRENRSGKMCRCSPEMNHEMRGSSRRHAVALF